MEVRAVNTKRWENFMVSEKNKNVVGGEQQQQYNRQRWGEKIERLNFYHVGRIGMIGKKSANKKFTGAGVNKGCLTFHLKPSAIQFCVHSIPIFNLSETLLYTHSLV